MSSKMAAGSTEETFGLLLNVLAQSLYVHEILTQSSALARQTVPHDRLVFGLISEDRERHRVLAHSEDESGGAALPEIRLQASRALVEEDWAIAHHVRTLPGKSLRLEGTTRTSSRPADEPFEWRPAGLHWAGHESSLRRPVRLRGGGLGRIIVLSRTP